MEYNFKIETIYDKHLYSIRYEGDELSVLDRLLDEWTDVDKAVDFMKRHENYLKSAFWSPYIECPEDAARKVLREAETYSEFFDNLDENLHNGSKPDFDSFFRELGGKYNLQYTYVPMKSYGMEEPSFLRIYAIKIESNCYLIVDGGIKLTKKIQDSPELKDHVFKNIDKVIDYLQKTGIIDGEDL